MNETQRAPIERLAFGNEAQAEMSIRLAIGINSEAVAFAVDRIMVKSFIDWMKRNWDMSVDVNTRQSIDQMAHPKIVKHSKKLMKAQLKKWGLSDQVKL